MDHNFLTSVYTRPDHFLKWWGLFYYPNPKLPD